MKKKKSKVTGMMLILLAVCLLFSMHAIGEGETAEPESVADEAFSGPFTLEHQDGFQIPIPENWRIRKSWMRDRVRGMDPEGKYMLQAFVTELSGVFFAQETWSELYPDLLEQLEAEQYRPVTIGEEEMAVEIPLDLEIDGEMRDDHRLRLLYGHGNHLLVVDLVSWAESVTPAAMDEVISGITWLGRAGEAVYSDYQLTLSLPEDEIPTTGKHIRVKADFANPDKVNESKNNNGIEWRVIARDSELQDLFYVNRDGVLNISKDLESAADFAVVAVSRTAGTQAYLELKALPQVRSLDLSETDVTLYMGQRETAELAVSTAPSDAARKIVWLNSDAKKLQLTEGEDGKASLRALKPGEVTVSARDELTGRQATAHIVITRPVTEMKISGKTEIRAGGYAWYRVKLNPADATDKRVKWSVDVDPKVAEIDGEGRLAVRQGVPAETEITVICEALGSADGLKAEYKVVVTE